MEDNSPLRRGKPSTHMIYGHAQTINAANYLYVLALQEVMALQNTDGHKIFVDELRKLHVGQSHDLYWTHNNHCPTVSEYMDMIANSK